MPLARSLYLLPLTLALTAQEPVPAPSPVEKPAEAKAEDAGKRAKAEFRHSHHRFNFRYHPIFGAFAQAALPLRDLKENLGHRTGFGLGVQWTHEHGDWNASRTRAEWNTFPEGGAVGPLGTKTYAKNYVVSLDHLFKLNQGRFQTYLVAGLGGARWNMEQTTAGVRTSEWTTKLAITGGVGVQIAERVNLEARYVVSSVESTFDANTLQASLGWRF